MKLYRRVTQSFVGLCCALAWCGVGAAQPGDQFVASATWRSATPEEVYARLVEYLDVAGISLDRQAAVREVWISADNDAIRGNATSDLLDRLASALAAADERVANLVEQCTATTIEPGSLPEFAWLADSETHPLVRHNMRLYLARWLVQQGYYDEAIAWSDGLTTSDVVAPDALLFYRAVAHHRLVEPDKALASLRQLLTRQEALPVRYQKLAELMQKDLSGLEDDSLDHIARRMEDVRRRLAMGRSGERVQGVENGVIESLDKLIKEIEDLLQQQGQSGQAQAGSQQAPTPMQDSRIAELKAPGKVDQRDIGHGAGWGDLPEKDREKALQDIGRDFPSHYREIIEQYFRRLAAEDLADR